MRTLRNNTAYFEIQKHAYFEKQNPLQIVPEWKLIPLNQAIKYYWQKPDNEVRTLRNFLRLA